MCKNAAHYYKSNARLKPTPRTLARPVTIRGLMGPLACTFYRIPGVSFGRKRRFFRCCDGVENERDLANENERILAKESKWQLLNEKVCNGFLFQLINFCKLILMALIAHDLIMYG